MNTAKAIGAAVAAAAATATAILLAPGGAHAAGATASHPTILIQPGGYRQPTMPVTVAGWGFYPDKTVTIRLGNAVMVHATPAANGQFKARFVVPRGEASGAYPVIASQPDATTARGELTIRVNWLHPGFNARNSSYNYLETRLGPLQVANLTPLWSTGYSSIYPILVDNGLMINGLNAYDASTGNLLWGHLPDGALAGVAVADGKLYAADSVDGINVYDESTGDYIGNWQAIPGYYPNFQSPPAIDGDTLYLINNNDLYAVDLTTLTTAWSVPFGSTATVHFAPTVANGTIYISAGQQVFAYDEATGGTKWNVTLPANNGIDGAPVVGPDGTIYIAGAGPTDGQAVLAAYDGTGALKWSRALGSAGGAIDGPAIANGVLYVMVPDSNNNSATLTALTAGDGSTIWTTPLAAGGAVGTPAVADGVVYATNGAGDSGLGSLAAYDTSGNLLATYPINPEGYDTIANGVLYVMSGDNGIEAYSAGESMSSRSK